MALALASLSPWLKPEFLGSSLPPLRHLEWNSLRTSAETWLLKGVRPLDPGKDPLVWRVTGEKTLAA